jgi:hypothetical protein
MLKIGNLILALLLVLPAALVAQDDIVVTTSASERTVRKGDRFALSIEIKGSQFRNVTRPTLPGIPGVVLQSAQPSTSTNYSFVNGVASRTYTFTYVYQADRVGSITIPTFSVTVDGREYLTNAFTMTVLDRDTSEPEESAEIYIRMEVSERRPVVGEQLLAELVLYFKPTIEILQFQIANSWRTDGFWKESLDDGTTPVAENIVIRGERYRRAVLSKHALFPNRSGELSIGEQPVTVTVRTAGRYADPFNVFFGNQRAVDLSTDAIGIRVAALPEPESGTSINAVGDFKITRRISNPTVSVGEAIELVTEISGSGNLALLTKPEYELPEGFETYQPSEDLNLTPTATAITGTRTFRDVIIARRGGTYTLPAAELAVYNPRRNEYQVTTLGAVIITVNRDTNTPLSYTSDTRFSMVPVMTATPWVTRHAFGTWRQWWFWLGIVLPLLLIVWGWRDRKNRDKLNSDYGFFRKTKAKERAMSKLAAITPEQDVKDTYAALYSALSGFICDKLGLPEAGLSDQQLLDAMTQAGVNAQAVSDAKRLFESCNTIRFAPVASRKDVAREQQLVLHLIQTISEVVP